MTNRGIKFNANANITGITIDVDLDGCSCL